MVETRRASAGMVLYFLAKAALAWAAVFSGILAFSAWPLQI
jgi:hypothetical protein